METPEEILSRVKDEVARENHCKYFSEFLYGGYCQDIDVNTITFRFNEEMKKQNGWIPYSNFEHINAPIFDDIVFLFKNGNKKRYNEDWDSDGDPTHFCILPKPPQQ